VLFSKSWLGLIHIEEAVVPDRSIASAKELPQEVKDFLKTLSKSVLRAHQPKLILNESFSEHRY
jgi:hypothetical protein